LLWLNGNDLREQTLLERKSRLRKLLRAKKKSGRVLYLDHIEATGSELFERARELDLEGIVAKWKDGRYVVGNRRSTWIKIKNPEYSQIAGRDELFENR
jgi:ATP-dependent DNA ligase